MDRPLLALKSSEESLNRIQIFLYTAVSFILGVSLFCGPLMDEALAVRITRLLNLLALLYCITYFQSAKDRSALKLLCIGLIGSCWFLFLRAISLGNRLPMLPFLLDYLIFLPYAAFEKEESSLRGLKILGFFYLCGTAVLCFFSILLCLRLLPPAMESFFLWVSLRLTPLWNANPAANIFMVAVFFSILFLCNANNLWTRVVNSILIFAFLFCLCLTDSRTYVIMCSVMLGGILPFVLFRRYSPENAIKKWTLLIGSGLIICICIYLIFHFTMIIAKTTFIADSFSEDLNVLMTEHNIRRSRKNLFSLGKRTLLWKAAFEKIKAEPAIWLLGSRHPNIQVSWMEETRTHNAWLESLIEMGLPGLIFFCYLTFLALKNGFILIFLRENSLLQKVVSIFVCCLLVTQIAENFIFCIRYPWIFANAPFLLCLGYMVCWEKESRPPKV